MSNNFGVWNEMLSAQKSMMDSWAGMMGMNKEASAAPNFMQFMPFMDYSKMMDWTKMMDYSKMMDFSKMGDYFKMQQSMMDNWNNWMSAFTPKQDEAMSGPFAAWQKAMSNYNPVEASKLLGNTANSVYDKMLKSNSFYLGLYDAWDNINKKVLTPGAEEYKENLDELLGKYDAMIMENFLPLLPDELKSMVMNPYNLIKTTMQSSTNFWQPWAESAGQMLDLVAQTALKDPSKSAELLKVWKKTYDSTFGALTTSPVAGSSKAIIEQNNKTVDAMIEMIVSMSEYMTSVGTVTSENTRKAFEEYVEMIQKGEQPKTFNEFFNMWVNKVEDAIEKHFYTEEFSNLIAFTTDAAMKFRIESDKAMERYLESTPVVTKSQIDSVYKTVYELKKEVKALKKAAAVTEPAAKATEAAK